MANIVSLSGLDGLGAELLQIVGVLQKVLVDELVDPQLVVVACGQFAVVLLASEITKLRVFPIF